MSGTINFYSENNFALEAYSDYEKWLKEVIRFQERELEEISYIFCDDEYLLDINQKYLNHDTYTDIIGFDSSAGKILQGDIFISTERVEENAVNYGVRFEEELKRVMTHGILHFCGFKDKTEDEKITMREEEERMMRMFHVEQ